jgi:glycosyltransferase involved in cell wall biosynthesis
VKLALVVQRYGADINGGAEQHARYIAERLAARHDVTVLTTCASDYITWRNALPEGEEQVGPVRVLRFPVSRERDPDEFGRLSFDVFERQHSLADELRWLDAEGPTSPALVRYLEDHADDFAYVLFFSFRYYHSYHGIRAVSDRAILVPTAERDAVMGMGMFPPVFRGVRAIMYNSHEERAMIQAAAGNAAVPGVVVGVGSHVPDRASAGRFRRAHGIEGPFVLYLGRIDENKGCAELFQFFQHYLFNTRARLTLALVGRSVLPIPDHPQIRHLGYMDDRAKFDALAACDALVMPSFYESLSMVALEAWAMGRPVLANARCDVLQGQCLRSNAGLFYSDYPEFAETLHTLTTNRALAEALGENGRAFYRAHYAWPVIDAKYEAMLERLQAADGAGRPAPMEPLPGWLARQRDASPPAREVLNGLPAGPAHDVPDAPVQAPRGRSGRPVARPAGPSRRRSGRRQARVGR